MAQQSHSSCVKCGSNPDFVLGGPHVRFRREARARLDAAVERVVPNYREIDQGTTGFVG